MNFCSLKWGQALFQFSNFLGVFEVSEKFEFFKNFHSPYMICIFWKAFCFTHMILAQPPPPEFFQVVNYGSDSNSNYYNRLKIFIIYKTHLSL